MPAPSGFDHLSTTKSNSTRSIASHPFDKLRAGSCNMRNDGAPSVGMVHAKIIVGHPPLDFRLGLCFLALSCHDTIVHTMLS